MNSDQVMMKCLMSSEREPKKFNVNPEQTLDHCTNTWIPDGFQPQKNKLSFPTDIDVIKHIIGIVVVETERVAKAYVHHASKIR